MTETIVKQIDKLNNRHKEASGFLEAYIDRKQKIDNSNKTSKITIGKQKPKMKIKNKIKKENQM